MQQISNLAGCLQSLLQPSYYWSFASYKAGFSKIVDIISNFCSVFVQFRY